MTILSGKLILIAFFLSAFLVPESFQTYVFRDAIADSPAFVRQEIFDTKEDWVFWKNPTSEKPRLSTHDDKYVVMDRAKSLSECKQGTDFISPDIQSVSYISNGKTLNATIWLTDEFEEPPLNDTLDVFQEQMEISISKTNMTQPEFVDFKNITLDPLVFNLDENNVTVAGNQAHEVIYSTKKGQNELKVMEIWMVKAAKAYEIIYTALLNNYSKYEPTIQQMIDSFRTELSSSFSQDKFGKNQSNSNNEDDYNDLSSYNNTEFKIKYPTNWEVYPDNTASSPDAKTLSNVIFHSPFEDIESEIIPWHELTFTMAVDINSVHDAGTDYRIQYSRIPNGIWTGNWTRQVQEISAYDTVRILKEEDSYSGMDDTDRHTSPKYLLFSFDLNDANFPKQYKAVFYVTDYFVKNHQFCRLIDTTNWVIIPPPEFSMSASPSSVTLRPSEERSIELNIKGNSALESEATLTAINNYNNDDIELSFTPNRMSVPATGGGTVTLDVKASETAKPNPYTFPIIANISFPTSITNRGGETFTNNRSVTITETSNLTLTVLPPYSFPEQLDDFTKAWITPVTGIWTLLVAVGAVVVPLVIKLYRDKNKKNKKIYD